MTYLDILQDKEIMAILDQIDILKQTEPKYYGIVHTLSTLEYAKMLAPCFNLNAHEKELLYIACALHNIGHLHGRTLHAQTGAEMAKIYLKKHGVNPNDIITICSAINSHTGKNSDNFYDPVSVCMILADKMDFASSRIKPNFQPLNDELNVCKNITGVAVELNAGKLELILSGKKVDWKYFVQTSVYSKLYRCFEKVCKKYGYKFVVRVKKMPNFVK